jgi:DNA-binding HxlR family transcriptional regulator
MLDHMVEAAAAHVAARHVCDAGLRRAFDFLGKRWNGVILATLSEAPMGFADLRRSVGSITDSVLSDRLAELTGAGLVQRTVTDTRPPGVNYQLSPSGQELLPILDQLGNWAGKSLPLQSC